MSVICHHGVKGQKRGVRHGPPYPINRNEPLQLVSLRVAASNGVLVRGMSSHASEQAKARNVKSEDIVDAIKRPLYIGDVVTDKQGRKSQRFIGNNATANVNPESGIITTVWCTGRKKRERLLKGG